VRDDERGWREATLLFLDGVLGKEVPLRRIQRNHLWKPTAMMKWKREKSMIAAAVLVKQISASWLYRDGTARE
jgi:hypothetical protein